MRHRVLPLATAGVSAALLATTLTAPAHAVAERRAAPVQITGSNTAFSPNGDGSKDWGVVTYRVNKPGRVTATVSKGGKKLLTVGLGRKAKGKQVFRWNGKRNGTVVSDGTYTVTLVSGRTRARTPLVVDAKFAAIDAGRVRVSSDTVYPRTTVIKDVVISRFVKRYDEVEANGGIDTVSWQVRDTAGRIVRSAKVEKIFDDLTCGAGCGAWNWDGRDDAGAIVPAGSYSMSAVQTSRAGNTFPIAPAVAITVSDTPLVKDTTTTTIPAAQARNFGPISDGNDSGIGDPAPLCEPTDSNRYSGGLSFNTQTVTDRVYVDYPCPASRLFVGDVPARRTLQDSFTLTVTGGPATAGGTGSGKLSVRGADPITLTGDTTTRVTRPVALTNFILAVDGREAATWVFRGNGYDLATFTYTLTEYVPAS